MRTFSILLLAWQFCLPPGPVDAGELQTAQSGSWTSSATWLGGIIPAMTDNVTIKSQHSVTLPASGTRCCAGLTIEAGGKLWSNSSSVTPRYLDVYGNITCNGTIGNGNTYDALAFNIEGAACLVSGSGTFDAARMRKIYQDNITTALTIATSVRLHFGGVALYNNAPSSYLNVTIQSGALLECTGNGTAGGNLAIDGTNGAGASLSAGSVVVNGTLTLTGKLYLQTNNTNISYPVSLLIGSGGVVNSDSIVCGNSGVAGHATTMNTGGLLNLTGGDWGVIGTTNNIFNFNTGSIISYSGSVSQSIGNPSPYANLVVSGTGQKSIGREVSVMGNLEIQNGSTLLVNDGKSLTVAGSLSLAGEECLVLKAVADTIAAGSLIVGGTVTGTGTIKVEHFLSKYNALADARFHLLSSPVTNQQIQPGFVENPPLADVDFYRWNEPFSLWQNTKAEVGGWNTSFQPGDDRTFHSGTGYLVAQPVDVIKTFSGHLNPGDVAPEITNTGEGFNLVGNPFTSALLGEIVSWTKSGVANAIWVWDSNSGNYLTWNGSAGSLAGGVIPAMQGFFIQANGPAPAISLPATSCIHSGRVSYKSVDAPLLQLKLTDNGYKDEAIIASGDGLDYGVNSGFDVMKLDGHPAAPQLYFLSADRRWSVKGVPDGGRPFAIPVGFYTKNGGRFSITACRPEMTAGGVLLRLEDRVKGLFTTLNQGASYTFTTDSGIQEDRFVLHFGNPEATMEVNPLQGATIHMVSNRLVVSGIPETDPLPEITVYDICGRHLLQSQCCPGRTETVLNLPPGVYLGVLTWQGKNLIRKIYLPCNHPVNLTK